MGMNNYMRNRRNGKYVPPQQPQVTKDDVQRANLMAEKSAVEFAEAARVGNIVRDRFHELQEMAAFQQSKIDMLAKKAVEDQQSAELAAAELAAAEKAAAEKAAAEKAAAEKAAAEKAAAEKAAAEKAAAEKAAAELAAAEKAAAERNQLIGLFMTSIGNLSDRQIRFVGGLCGITGTASKDDIFAELGMRMRQMGTHQIQDCLTAFQAVRK
jgi:membrane protein involved in colicin uptake